VQRLAAPEVQDVDQQTPLRQRVQAAHVAEELGPRHVRQPEAGDDQRDRPARGAQPLEDAQPASRVQRAKKVVIRTIAVNPFGGEAGEHIRIAVNHEDAGGLFGCSHLGRGDRLRMGIAPRSAPLRNRPAVGSPGLPLASRRRYTLLAVAGSGRVRSAASSHSPAAVP